MLIILTTLLSKYKCNPLLHQEQKITVTDGQEKKTQISSSKFRETISFLQAITEQILKPRENAHTDEDVGAQTGLYFAQAHTPIKGQSWHSNLDLTTKS